MFVIARDSGPEIVTKAFVGNDGVKHPSTVLRSWTPDELAEIGVYAVTVEKPAYNPASQQVGYASTPTLVDGVWTLTATVVDLTPEQLADKLRDKREEASIPKAEFVLGLINLGILQLEDALASSKGNWPAPMLAFLDYLTPEQATQAQIEWATRTEIWRTNTFVLSLASFLGLSDQTVDALFGIE